MRGQSRRIACRLGESLDEDHDRQAVIDAARQRLFVAGLLLPGVDWSTADHTDPAVMCRCSGASNALRNLPQYTSIRLCMCCVLADRLPISQSQGGRTGLVLPGGGAGNHIRVTTKHERMRAETPASGRRGFCYAEEEPCPS